MDVVNQPKLPAVQDWVKKNYTLSNFRATCKECQKTFYFVSTEGLQNHIKRKHESTYQFEERHKGERWRNFRKTGDSNDVVCVVCDKPDSVDDTFIHQHRADDTQILTDIDYDWVFKYFRKTSGSVLSAYCILCERNETITFAETIFLHFKCAHLKEWKERPPFSEKLTALSGVVERLKLFLKIYDHGEWELDDWEHRTRVINWLKRKYQFKSNFRAECKKCFDIFSSIDTVNFDEHLYDEHRNYYDEENLGLKNDYSNAYWINFRIFIWKLEVQCVICSNTFPIMTNDWRKHLHDNDNNYIRHYTWQCKYVTEIEDGNDDFKGRCNVCSVEHDFDFMPAIHLFFHIFDNKCRNLMRKDYLGPENDPRPRDDLAMQGQGMKRPRSCDEPSTSRKIN
nr:PREDICTED: uncharacterized protein LOC105679304 isoform X1 [Linepithema humile]